MNRIVGELLRVAKDLVSTPMAFIEPDSQTLRWAKSALMGALNVDKSWKQVYSQLMVVQEGSSNKFHYFGAWQDKNGRSIGGNAYGRIGYNPKSIEIARGEASSVIRLVDQKASMKKRSKGYHTVEV